VPLVSGIPLPLPTAAVGRASWASTAELGGGPVVHHDPLVSSPSRRRSRSALWSTTRWRLREAPLTPLP